MAKQTICDDFHFGLHSMDFKATSEALRYYQKHKITDDSWLYNDSHLPIFIDTNILLDLYRTSIRSRDQFLTFIKKNSQRIIITGQVCCEFMKHRREELHKAPTKIEEISNGVRSFINNLEKSQEYYDNRFNQWFNERGFQNDMENVRIIFKEIQQYIKNNSYCAKEEFKMLLLKAKESVDADMKALTSKIIDEETDNIVETLTNVQILEELSNEEKLYLQELYKSLWEKAKDFEGNIIKRCLYAFPGRGDHDKEDEGLDPCGDFYIYHEIMKYMLEYETDAIFLTKDVTKYDWTNGDKPYISYIVDTFAHTQHIIHICDAKEFNFGLNSVVDGKLDISNTNKLEEALADQPVEIVNNQDQIQIELAHDVNDNGAETIKTEDVIQLEDLYEYPFRQITEERFLSELQCTTRWSQNYGNGHISTNFFIRDILAPKMFDLKSCYNMKDALKADGIIKEEEVEIDGHTFVELSICSNNI